MSTNSFGTFKNVCLLKSVLGNSIEVVEVNVISFFNYVALTQQLYVLALEKRRIDHFALFQVMYSNSFIL